MIEMDTGEEKKSRKECLVRLSWPFTWRGIPDLDGS
jgi:hypothetical protein